MGFTSAGLGATHTSAAPLGTIVLVMDCDEMASIYFVY